MKTFTRRRVILCTSVITGLFIVVNTYMVLMKHNSTAFHFYAQPFSRYLKKFNTQMNESSSVLQNDKAITAQTVTGTTRQHTSLRKTPSTIRPSKPEAYFGGHLAESKVWGVPLQVRGRPTSLLKRSPTPVVPNIVHYVWFGNNPLRFHHMLSMISACKFIKPDKIFLHCDQEPLGKWWQLVKKNITTLVIIPTTAPRVIFGNPVGIPEHQADVVRIESLMQYGGIYLDFDVFVLKSFEELRHYEYVMGIEYHKPGIAGRLNNGVIIANKTSAFLKLWYESYHYFNARSKNWDHQSCIVPYYMQYEFPYLIHVEEQSLNYPSGLITRLIYQQVYDWSHNYAMHLWFRLHDIEHSPEDIKRMETTFGEMARYIFYGSKEII